MSAACSARRQVLQARVDYGQGRISADEKRLIEDEAIRTVVRMQQDIGLQGVTDGEYRRASWHMDFIYQIGGITKAHDNLKVQFHNEKGDIEFTPGGHACHREAEAREMHLRG